MLKLAKVQPGDVVYDLGCGDGRVVITAAKEFGARGVGIDIDSDSLDAVVADSQRYPYFIQVWGRALWQQRLATGPTRLTVAHVDTARPDVAARVTDYYQDRYRELESADLLAAAVATALLFEGAATASDHAIDAALATTGADSATRLAAREELNLLGYVWSPPGQLPPVVWIVGIPSLMTYVLDCAPPALGGVQPGK